MQTLPPAPSSRCDDLRCFVGIINSSFSGVCPPCCLGKQGQEAERLALSPVCLAPQQALRWLQLSAHKVDTLGLFSPNEQAEDVATADLKYLLVPYLLAEAQSRDSTQDKALHLQRLEEAASSLRT